MVNSAMSEIYCLSAYSEMRPFHANWTPTTSVRIGDYGLREGAMFRRLGNIETLGLELPSVRVTGGDGHHTFSSGSGTRVSLSPSVDAKGVATIQASVSFESAYSVFLNAAGCSQTSVSDKADLGKKLDANFSFDKTWVVVTDIVASKNLILAISSDQDGEFSFSVNAERFDWADASASFSFGSQKSVGYLDLGEEDRIPLIGLCGFTGGGLLRRPRLSLFGAEPESKAQSADEGGVVFAQL